MTTTKNGTFLNAVLSGAAAQEDIDDYVRKWHEGASQKSLREFLGFTREDYARWLLDADVLDSIINKESKVARPRWPLVLVNTGQRWDANLESYTLKRHRAAVSSALSKQLDRVAIGTRVLLYSNGKGVIAGGMATPQRSLTKFHENRIQYVQLSNFFELREPIRASEIKIRFGVPFPRHAVTPVSGETAERLWNESWKRRRK